MDSHAGVQSGLDTINQAFKERSTQEQAKQQGLPYVNLLNVPIDPDLATLVDENTARSAQAVPFFKVGKKVRLATAQAGTAPLQALLAQLEDADYTVQLHLCSEESLQSGFKIYAHKYIKSHEDPLTTEAADVGSFAEEIENLAQLKGKIESATFDMALNYIQAGAYKSRASDIHFLPEESSVEVRFRVDGVLQRVFELSRKTYEGLLTEVKHIARLKMNVVNVPQDGQYRFTIGRTPVNVRVSLLPTHYGESCVMRLLNSHRAGKSFEDLGFQGAALELVKQAVSLSHGMVLVTGPTGSGKTTTLYAMLQAIDTKAKKVITLEDPIEYDLPGISQSQVHPEIGYDFATGLRAILRQDPDVILVGEVRDLETAETATQASLTGHLVFSTLHTNSAVESIPRLVNMGLKAFVLAPALNMIVAQRLTRRLCSNCQEKRPATEAELKEIQPVITRLTEKGLSVNFGGTIGVPKGCDQCGQSGFLGQLAITEVLPFTDALRNMLLEEKPLREIEAYIDKELHMVTLMEDGIFKVIQGLTTLDEVHRVAA